VHRIVQSGVSFWRRLCSLGALLDDEDEHSINEVIAYECCVVVGESVVMTGWPEFVTRAFDGIRKEWCLTICMAYGTRISALITFRVLHSHIFHFLTPSCSSWEWKLEACVTTRSWVGNCVKLKMRSPLMSQTEFHFVHSFLARSCLITFDWECVKGR